MDIIVQGAKYAVLAIIPYVSCTQDHIPVVD